jgi:hypothetical protein
MSSKLAHAEFMAAESSELKRLRDHVVIKMTPLNRKLAAHERGGPELTAEEENELTGYEDQIDEIDAELRLISEQQGRYDFERWRLGREAEADRFRTDA